MLGTAMHDPLQVETDAGEANGMGLLPIATTFTAEKQTVRARGKILSDRGLFAHARGLAVSGYEIHMGQTQVEGEALIQVTSRGGDIALAAEDLDADVPPTGKRRCGWLRGERSPGGYCYVVGPAGRGGFRSAAE
jgi:hypothetical protein